MGEQALTLVEGREAERRHIRLEVPHRMRIEGCHDHGLAQVEAERDRAAHHRLVAEVETVEIAEREDRAAKLIGNDLVVVQPLHRARLYRRIALIANQWVGRCFRSSRYSCQASRITKASRIDNAISPRSCVKL